MQIEDSAILIGFSKFQENKLIIECFSSEHGLIKGLCRSSPKNFSARCHPGDLIKINWKARLREHLGFIQIDTIKSSYYKIFQNGLKSAILSSMLSLLHDWLNEGEHSNYLYDLTMEMLKVLQEQSNALDIIKQYVLFEMAIIDYSGFGLDLAKCAVTHKKSDLAYISPKSGCAISLEIGSSYDAKLFKMPSFFISNDNTPSAAEVKNAINVTKFFLENRSYSESFKKLPSARAQIYNYL